MIKQNQTHLSLGLRPSGKYELVEKSTGRASFQDRDLEDSSTVSVVDLLVNPLDISFLERPRSFLEKLREERRALLSSRKKKSARKGETDETSLQPGARKTNRGSTRKPKELSPTLETSLLSGLGADGQRLLEMLKRNAARR